MKSLIKVGVFATLCLIALGILIWKIEDINPFGTKGQHFRALFDSVAGLDDKASVRIAGVRVGHVDGLSLSGTRARVNIAGTTPPGRDGADQRHRITSQLSTNDVGGGMLADINHP